MAVKKIVPPKAKWKQNLWGLGTWVALVQTKDLGRYSFEVFEGGGGGRERGAHYQPGWYARVFTEGGQQYNLAQRVGGGWGGSYDWEHEIWRFETADDAIAAVQEWWDGELPEGTPRVLHGDYVRTDNYIRRLGS